MKSRTQKKRAKGAELVVPKGRRGFVSLKRNMCAGVGYQEKKKVTEKRVRTGAKLQRKKGETSS